jgi:hypothetical protein
LAFGLNLAQPFEAPFFVGRGFDFTIAVVVTAVGFVKKSKDGHGSISKKLELDSNYLQGFIPFMDLIATTKASEQSRHSTDARLSAVCCSMKPRPRCGFRQGRKIAQTRGVASHSASLPI